MGMVAQAPDRSGEIPDLGDFEAEFFSHFDGLSQADGAVVDHEVHVLVGVFFELDDAADAEFEDFPDFQAFFGDFDDEGHFDGEDTTEVVLF